MKAHKYNELWDSHAANKTINDDDKEKVQLHV